MKYLFRRNNLIKYILVCLLVLIFYSLLIYFIPGYITDDYSIIKIIKNNSTLFSHNPLEKYYLFLRPVTYLLFNVDFLILNNPVFSKVLSLILLIITLFVIGNLISEFLKLSKNTISNTDYILIMTFLFTNVNVAYSVIWIADRNEILMCLFYFLSIFLYLKYIDNFNKILLVLIPICFLLSILSKQQSLHLPFVLLLLRLLINKRKTNKSEIIFYFSMFLIMVFTVIANNYFLKVDTQMFLSNLWKKGFWVIKSLVYSFVPFVGDYLHIYFTNNKMIAIITLLVSIIIILLSRKIVFNKKLVISSLIYLITFFPIIIIDFYPRSVFLSFVLFILLLLFNYDVFNKSIFARTILLFLILFNSIFTFNYAFSLNKYDSFTNEVISNLENNTKRNMEKTLIISHIYDFEDRLNAPFLSYQDSLIFSLPIFPINVGYYLNPFVDTSDFSIELNHELISIKSKSDDICIATNGKDTIMIDSVAFAIISTENKRTKPIQSVIVKPINYEMFLSNFKYLAYLNGLKWEFIDLTKSNTN